MRYLITAIIFCLTFSAPTFALSDTQKSSVSQNCNSIKQTLRTVQRSDARTRVYLGSIYQIVLANYMTQLNLRLVKNNQPSAPLSSDQTNFTSARDEASQRFIIYSQALEELLLIDCSANPEAFYDKLTDTRKKRDELSESTAKVRKILNSHLETVTKLKEGMS